MNIAFWIPAVLAVCAVWIVATASLFSARVGKRVSKVYEDVRKGIRMEDHHE